MGEATWEMCSAETLLEQFFAQDDLGKLTVSTGELLGCPLLVLDDTFHVAAHRRDHQRKCDAHSRLGGLCPAGG